MINATPYVSGLWTLIPALLFAALLPPSLDAVRGSDDPPEPKRSANRKLSHEETLRWIAEHRAWRLARKTKPIWARPVTPEEVGKEFQTADHVKEVARKDAWLCVGLAGEPWFQSREKIEAKYKPAEEKTKKFDFDTEARRYRIYKPNETTRNWVAQVKGPEIEGFSIRPGYDPTRLLYSPAGGYLVCDEVPDPYQVVQTKDIWLVQQALFESTYELLPEPETPSSPASPAPR